MVGYGKKAFHKPPQALARKRYEQFLESKTQIMTIEQLFTIYWSQVTLLLLAVGYFIKRIFDNISKRQEINHSLFQQKKLEAVNSFFKTYAKAQQMWLHIRIYQILRNEFSAVEIDEMIFPTLNELNKNLLELQIYFDEKQHNKFKMIFENISLINAKLSKLYFDVNPNMTNTQKSNEFYFYREELLEKNEMHLAEITAYLRKSFR